MAHKFNINKAKHLDSPERLAQENPTVLFDAVGLGPGVAAADIGCGTGFYTIPMAQRVGPQGTVFAFDIQQEMLDIVAAKIGKAGLGNVVVKRSGESSLDCADDAVHAAFIVVTLHEAESKEALLGEIRRILRPGGKLIVVDWKKEATSEGPPMAERLDEAEAGELLVKSGFGNLRKIVLWADLYGIEAQKI